MNNQQLIVYKCIDEILEHIRRKKLSLKVRGVELFTSESHCDHDMKCQEDLEIQNKRQKIFIMMKKDQNLDPDFYLSKLNLSLKNGSLIDTLELFLNTNYYNHELTYNPREAKVPLEVDVTPAQQYRDDSDPIASKYPMRSNPRVFALIINLIHYQRENFKRPYGKYDSRNLKKLYEKLGSEVFAYGDDERDDLTVEGIRNIFRRFLQMRELQSADSCFIYINGHGGIDVNNNQVIFGTDYINEFETPNSAITVQEIMTYFSSENCPSMLFKPKIFCFDICRKMSVQNVPYLPESYFEELKRDERKVNIRGRSVFNFQDILVINGTLNHCLSYSIEYGSLFTSIFCEALSKRAWCNHIDEILKLIKARFDELYPDDGSYQSPDIVEIRCHKQIYLNPGLP